MVFWWVVGGRGGREGENRPKKGDVEFGQGFVLEIHQTGGFRIWAEFCASRTPKKGTLEFGQGFVFEIHQTGGFRIWAEFCA